MTVLDLAIAGDYNVITGGEGAMKARLIQIGNSRGIRLPRSVIDQAGLGDEVELQVLQGSVVISRSPRLREGWAEAAAAMADRGEDTLVHPPARTRFEDEEWEW